MVNKTIQARLSAINLIFFIIVIIIVSHLYLLQITKNSFFSNLGHQQYTVTLKTVPTRAALYDCNGALIATQKPIISMFISPKYSKNTQAISCFLEKNYPDALIRLSHNPDAYFMYVARNISEKEAEKISTAPDDIFLLEEPGRYYPLACLSPIIGKTDIDTRGISGIELVYNTQLSGAPTTVIIEKDARSGRYYFNKKTLTQGTTSCPLRLTIDSTLQFLAYEELKETITKYGATEGAVVIMNPENGALYSMVTIPHLDPNEQNIKDLSLLKNRVVTETYEFGSVMKTFLALAALEEKIYTAQDIIDCENKKNGSVNGMKFTTWKAHGQLTFSEVIEYSNNIGTAKIAQKLGIKLYEHYRRCGFGQETGLLFPGEQKGYITHPKTWSKASLNSLSFGYEIRATMLQLARAFSLFANGGYLPTPHLVFSDYDKESEKKILYSAEALNTMRMILEKTCTEGTAHAARIPGVTVLGKTGTARLLDETGKYSSLKHIYTFSGIIEKGSYKRVIVTFIKEASRHDLYASTVAAPLFERIAQKMLIHDKIS